VRRVIGLRGAALLSRYLRDSTRTQFVMDATLRARNPAAAISLRVVLVISWVGIPVVLNSRRHSA